MMTRIVIKSVLLAFLFSLASARPAFAYVDPNVGGMLFQALAAGFAVLSGIALLFSRQIRMFFARMRRARRDISDQDEQQEASTYSQTGDGD